MTECRLLRVLAARGGLLMALVVLGGMSERAVAEENSQLAAAVQSITTDDVMRHLETLADDRFEGREAGSRGGRASNGYLVSELERIGIQPGGPEGAWQQMFHGNFSNILAVVPGSDPKLAAEYLLVGAHYDHVGYGTRTNSYGPWGYIHNGADDNASGTAVLLELAEAFMKLPAAPKRTVLFAFWDGEEKGLLGSKHWVASPTRPLDKLKLAINLDMVGRLRQDRVELSGSRTSWGLRQAVSLAAQESGLKLDFTWQVKSNSDHWTFYERQIPYLMYHTGLHNEYHRPSDDVELINGEGMQRIARVMFPLLHEMANADSLPGFRQDCLSETERDRRQLEGAARPLPPRLGISWSEPADGETGLKVIGVVADSPAATAGVRIGDVLSHLDEVPLQSGEQLLRGVLIAQDEIRLTVERTGEEPAPVAIELAGKPVRIGIAWRVDPAEPRSVFLTRVVPGSAAAAAGLRYGDRVYRVDGQAIQGSEQFGDLIRSVASEAELLIEQGGIVTTRTLRIDEHLPAEVELADSEEPEAEPSDTVEQPITD